MCFIGLDLLPEEFGVKSCFTGALETAGLGILGLFLLQRLGNTMFWECLLSFPHAGHILRVHNPAQSFRAWPEVKGISAMILAFLTALVSLR